MKHGRESTEHIRMKILVEMLFALLGWNVLFEQRCCDVLIWRISNKSLFRILNGEAERSLRNAIPNALRNFSTGCDGMITLVPDDPQRMAIRRHYQRHLPRKLWTKIAVITIPQIERQIKRLHASSGTSFANTALAANLKNKLFNHV